MYPLRKIFILLILITFSTIDGFSQPIDSIKSVKSISITLDDLPLNIAHYVSTEEMKSIVEKLISKIRAEGMPVVGFVNENKLEVDGTLDVQRLNILKTWLDSGIELGNHTYSHKSANSVPVIEYEQDIIHGEKIIKGLMAEKGMKLRYFRHPFLMTGRSMAVNNEITKFLIDHGYTVAPVTIDNSEWIFSAAYDKAKNNGDTLLMMIVGQEYIKYIKAKLQYYERQSNKLFGRQINQILLIHSNRLNSEYFTLLCTMMKDRRIRSTRRNWCMPAGYRCLLHVI